MSSLKDKPLKKCHTDKRKMIDDIHTEMIQNLPESELTKYYLDNGVILDKYYSGDEEININTQDDARGILSFLKPNLKMKKKRIFFKKERCYE